eukprot:gene8707-17992_t
MAEWIQSIEYIPDIFGAASYLRGQGLHEEVLTHDKKLHVEGVELGKVHHDESVNVARKQHNEAITLARQTHFRDMSHGMEEHFHELNTDLINATRAGERSMYDQRNAEFQTLIISATVMFSGLSSVIVQGYLPGPSVTDPFIYIYMSVSFRSSKFMYARANKQSQRVTSVIDKSVDLMRQLRNFYEIEKWRELDARVHDLHDDIIRSFLADERVEKVLQTDVSTKRPKVPPKDPSITQRLARAFSIRAPSFLCYQTTSYSEIPFAIARAPPLRCILKYESVYGIGGLNGSSGGGVGGVGTYGSINNVNSSVHDESDHHHHHHTTTNIPHHNSNSDNIDDHHHPYDDDEDYCSDSETDSMLSDDIEHHIHSIDENEVRRTGSFETFWSRHCELHAKELYSSH